jgi:hypothetical protein
MGIVTILFIVREILAMVSDYKKIKDERMESYHLKLEAVSTENGAITADSENGAITVNDRKFVTAI